MFEFGMSILRIIFGSLSKIYFALQLTELYSLLDFYKGYFAIFFPKKIRHFFIQNIYILCFYLHKKQYIL